VRENPALSAAHIIAAVETVPHQELSECVEVHPTRLPIQHCALLAKQCTQLKAIRTPLLKQREEPVHRRALVYDVLYHYHRPVGQPHSPSQTRCT